MMEPQQQVDYHITILHGGRPGPPSVTTGDVARTWSIEARRSKHGRSRRPLRVLP